MLKGEVRAWLASRRLSWLREPAFFLRGLLFLGSRHQCPVCGWRLRAFTTRGGLLARSESGYCPRCNAKARHRRLWLYLAGRTALFRTAGVVLEVAPWWSLSRRLARMPGLRYVGVDLAAGHAGVTVVGDAAALPFAAGSFDALLCIHVLEHVAQDRAAIAELRRVLKPGGWAVVSVPLRLDRPTHEDPAVTDPAERARLFGERGHVRYYGADFRERLQAAGFAVEMDPAAGLAADLRRRFGLRDDENLFCCRNPAPAT